MSTRALVLLVAFAAVLATATPSASAQAFSCGGTVFDMDGKRTTDEGAQAFVLTKVVRTSCPAARTLVGKAIRYYDKGCQMGSCAPQGPSLGSWRCSARAFDGSRVRYSCKRGRASVVFASLDGSSAD